MSSDQSENHPIENPGPSAPSLLTPEGREQIEQYVREVVAQSVLAGRWPLVQAGASLLYELRGLPESSPYAVHPPNAARFPYRYVATPRFHARTAGDTPAGEQPYDEHHRCDVHGVDFGSLEDYVEHARRVHVRERITKEIPCEECVHGFARHGELGCRQVGCECPRTPAQWFGPAAGPE